jgi:hypothetical protein
MAAEYILTSKEFTVDSIDSYLLDTKNMLIKMNILLDTNEINKCLSNSLNRALLKSNFSIDDIYKYFDSNWEDVVKDVSIIEEKVRIFNKSQNYEYYVDMEDVFYLFFYKQIDYVRKILLETMQYLNSNVNLIYIYTFIIQAFYDEPISFSNNYIFILNKLVNSTDGKVTTETIKDFFAEPKITKLKSILTLLYDADTKFNELITHIFNSKNRFIGSDIRVPIDKNYNNFNCINKGESLEEKIETKTSVKLTTGVGIKMKNDESMDEVFGKTRDIEIVEKEFNGLKCNMLFGKRDIAIEKIYEGLEPLLANEVKFVKEFWLGVMLFLYKKYTFDFEDFRQKIDALLKKYGYDQEFIPSIDAFTDLRLPDSIYITKQLGGSGINTYLNKYLKYKAKYLKLKEIKFKKK